MVELFHRVRAALADRYEIEGEVGHGGMAVVFRARDPKHGRAVAIKVLRPELAAVLGSERFLREIEIAAGLNHPNVLALHDSGEADGLLFYVMPFVEGESLRDRLEREGALSVEEAVRVTREVADALGYAHAHGLVHRDIKPANVLFQAGHALVADFGIARAVSGAGTARLTETGLAVGTIQYMSPEQALGDEDVDARSDLYSLGCVFYEMLTGARPFSGESAPGLLAQKVTGRAPDPTDVRSDLPPTLNAVVRKALASEPDQRYSSAAALTGALDTAITSGAIALEARHRRWRRLGALSAAIAVVGVLVVASGWLAQRGDTPAIHRLAVLPITDFTNTPDQEYLVEGLHQALITELQHAGMTIIGRRGVLRYAGSDAPVREIAEHLHVDAVVDASLLRSGDTVSIQVSLIDGNSEAQIWSEDFQQAMGDVVTLYQEVTQSIADEIRFTVTPERAARLAQDAGPVDPQVYDLILQGRFNRAKLTPDGIDASQRYFEQALDVDPDNAMAWAELSLVWGVRVQQGLMSVPEARPRVESARARALALDPELSLSEVQYMLAVGATWGEWDFDAATPAYEAALGADPNNAVAAAYFAHHLHIIGRHEDATRMFERALDLDPDDGLVQVLYGMELMFEGRYDYAVERMEDALRMTPNDPIALSTLRTAYHMTGEQEKAIDIWKRSYESQGHPERVDALERGWEEGGYSAALRAVAERMQEQSSQGIYVTPWQIGTLYTRAGDEERALDFLEQAYDVHDPNVPYLTVDPIFDFMRDNPRFQAIIDALGLNQEG